MAIRFAIQELAAAVICVQCSGQEVGEIIESQDRNLIFTIFDVQLRVIEDAAECQRMFPMNPVVDRRTFVLVLKDSRICEISRRADTQLVARSR